MNNEPQHETTTGSVGVVRGVPGAHVSGVGVLDLRGLSPESLSALKSVEATGTILIDAGLRTGLAHVKLESVGAVAEIAPEERLITQPMLEFSGDTLEAMTPGQSLTVIGVVTFRPDVPAALVQEKFDSLRVIGVLIASAAVQGALMGKMDLQGASVTLRRNAGQLIRSMGHTRLTSGYLTQLAPEMVYLNLGRTDISEDVSATLLSEKIAEYHNLGATLGPASLLEILQARCPTNYGAFEVQLSEKTV